MLREPAFSLGMQTKPAWKYWIVERAKGPGLEAVCPHWAQVHGHFLETGDAAGRPRWWICKQARYLLRFPRLHKGP